MAEQNMSDFLQVLRATLFEHTITLVEARIVIPGFWCYRVVGPVIIDRSFFDHNELMA